MEFIDPILDADENLMRIFYVAGVRHYLDMFPDITVKVWLNSWKWEKRLSVIFTMWIKTEIAMNALKQLWRLENKNKLIGCECEYGGGDCVL